MLDVVFQDALLGNPSQATPVIILFALQFAVVPLFIPLQLHVNVIVPVVTPPVVPALHRFVVGAVPKF